KVALFWAMGSSGDSLQGIAAGHVSRGGALYPARAPHHKIKFFELLPDQRLNLALSRCEVLFRGKIQEAVQPVAVAEAVQAVRGAHQQGKALARPITVRS